MLMYKFEELLISQLDIGKVEFLRDWDSIGKRWWFIVWIFRKHNIMHDLALIFGNCVLEITEFKTNELTKRVVGVLRIGIS